MGLHAYSSKALVAERRRKEAAGFWEWLARSARGTDKASLPSGLLRVHASASKERLSTQESAHARRSGEAASRRGATAARAAEAASSPRAAGTEKSAAGSSAAASRHERWLSTAQRRSAARRASGGNDFFCTAFASSADAPQPRSRSPTSAALPPVETTRQLESGTERSTSPSRAAAGENSPRPRGPSPTASVVVAPQWDTRASNSGASRWRGSKGEGGGAGAAAGAGEVALGACRRGPGADARRGEAACCIARRAGGKVLIVPSCQKIYTIDITLTFTRSQPLCPRKRLRAGLLPRVRVRLLRQQRRALPHSPLRSFPAVFPFRRRPFAVVVQP